jgi:hypothetical protein
MKYKLFFGGILLVLCAGPGTAQPLTMAPDRPLTYMERNMYACTNMNELQKLYSSLQTDYDRRYFLGGLPGFMAERKIAAPPRWVRTAVVDGLSSKDALVVFNAANVANVLRINCAPELMACYKAVHNTFGSYEDMLKAALLHALGNLDDMNKHAFLQEILTKDNYSPASGAFTALLDALESYPATTYLPKLSACSDTLDSWIARLRSEKGHELTIKNYQAVQSKIRKLELLIGGK